MTDIQTYEGDFSVPDARIALVASRFNHFIVDSLVAGAVDALVRHGVARGNLTKVLVPGAYELPLAVRRVAAGGKVDGIVALGAVIRGSTPHFEYVAGECVSGLSAVMREFDLPVGFGVLTVDSIEQAIERAGTKAGNKGAEAALGVLEMISLLGKLGASS